MHVGYGDVLLEDVSIQVTVAVFAAEDERDG